MQIRVIKTIFKNVVEYFFCSLIFFNFLPMNLFIIFLYNLDLIIQLLFLNFFKVLSKAKLKFLASTNKYSLFNILQILYKFYFHP